MAAKATLFILGGLLILPRIFQFISIIQLQSYRDTFMGAAVEMAINQKILFGTILLIIGAGLVLIASRIEPRTNSEE